MDINKVLMEYDHMFGTCSLEVIDEFLSDKIEEALSTQDYSSALTLMNEMVGFCRDTDQKEKGLHYCELTLRMLNNLGLGGTVEYATSLLNVANAMRAFGVYDRSGDYYRETETIYLANLKPEDFSFSSLYNNWSLLYQEIGDYASAETLLRKALAVVEHYPNAQIELATTKTNLAMTILSALRAEQSRRADSAFDGPGEDFYEAYDDATSLLFSAIAIYEADGGRDMHYSAALSTKGDAMMLIHEYAEAANYFKRAMEEVEKHVGRTEAYDRVEERYERAKTLAGGNYEAPEEDSAFESANEPAPEESFSAQPAPAQPTPAQTAPVQTAPSVEGGHLKQCKDFFEKYGLPMIEQEYPDLLDTAAFGMAGDGSDCFGFDDEISRDHDFEIGFCIWMTDADYDRYGISLRQSYNALVEAHAEEYGLGSSVKKAPSERRGPMRIGDFYEQTLGLRLDEHRAASAVMTDDLWMRLEEARLAASVNGAVWRDEGGTFSEIRSVLAAYYPENIWRMKLAEQLHAFSQSAQANYPRMMARGDVTTASICKSRGIEATLRITYLLNRTYAPYYKWMRKGVDKLAVLKSIARPVDRLAALPIPEEYWQGVTYNAGQVYTDDPIVAQFEKLAMAILSELSMQELVDGGKDPYLDLYVGQIANLSAAPSVPVTVREERAVAGDFIEDVPEEDSVMDEALATSGPDPSRATPENEDPQLMTRDQLIESIVAHEWKQFDAVKNEGGRADCQDNWNTFSIMRKSQYMTWEDELLKSYLMDLLNAEAVGWNMITEKYGRMMKSTAPEEYERMKDSFPARTEEHEKIAEAIIEIQVGWMEEFAAKYPNMAGNARIIHTSEDGPYNTSYETYLRGELGTYSDDTLYLYGRFVVGLKRQGLNLAYMTMNNTAKLYGYRDVKDAEEKLSYK